MFLKGYKVHLSLFKQGRLVGLILALVLVAQTNVIAQVEEGQGFNQERKHGISLGFSITSFSKNLTYQVSPAYHFRAGRHEFMFNPFIGRLDAIDGQFDVGVGLNYRLFPFKNGSDIRLFMQTGADYVFQENKTRSVQSFLYRVGPGVEAGLSEKLKIGVNVDLGVLDEVNAESKDSELVSSNVTRDLQIVFLPFIWMTYTFGK